MYHDPRQREDDKPSPKCLQTRVLVSSRQVKPSNGGEPAILSGMAIGTCECIFCWRNHVTDRKGHFCFHKTILSTERDSKVIHPGFEGASQL